MAGSFFTLAAIRRLGATDDQVGGFTLIFVISQTLTNLFWGYLGDKKGYKLLTALGALGQIAAALIAVWANSISLFYLIFAITGAALSLEMIANLNIVLEFGPREERPTYIGLANTIRSPFTGLAPVLGGVIADRLSFEAVFLTTISLVVLGFLWLSFAVVEPRKYNPVI
jgi:MFS family permease